MSTQSRTFSLSSCLYNHKIISPPDGYPNLFVVDRETEQLQQQLMLLSKKALEDPILKQEICERIFVLMQEEIEQEKERCQPSWGRL